jgi:hypothetical protein
MQNPPGYWAAVRLTAFANCEISEANWRTLWPVRRKPGFQPAPRPREIAARGGFVPENLQDSIRASIRLAPGRAPKEGNVIEARGHVATLRAMKLEGAEALLKRFGAIEESPFRPWPRRGHAARYLGHAELRAIHAKTREHLASVCTGKAQALIRVLGRRRFSPERLVILHHSQLGDVPALVPYPETHLSLHLDRLFLETLVAGLWGRFYQCGKCGSFGVRSRLGERTRQWCTQSKCRVARHRAKRKLEDDARRAAVVAAWRTSTGSERERIEAVRRQFGLTLAAVRRFLK